MIAIKQIKNVLLVSLSVLTFNACKKTPDTKPLDGAGQTLVKFIFTDNASNPNGIPDTASGKYAGYQLLNVDLVSTPQTLEVADLRRDVPNSDELNKKMTIIIQNDPGAVTDYDSELLPMPVDAYVPDASNPLSGGNYTIVLQPGEFAKVLKLTIPDITVLDLTKRYGFGFTITTIDSSAAGDANGHISVMQKRLVVEVGTKNKWDGIYRLFGGFSRSDQPGFLGVTLSPTGYYQPYYLVTQGSASVDPCINTASGLANTQMIYNAGTSVYTYFTGVAPRLNIDKTTNAVTVTPGVAITPPSVAFTQSAAELAASKYYPNGIPGHPYADGKSTIVVHFKWTATAIDRNTKDTFVYLQPR